MRLTLATRFSATVLGVVALAIGSSLATLYGAWRLNQRLDEIGREDLASVRAEDVEVALLQGNDLIASYLLDKSGRAERSVPRAAGGRDWEKEYRQLQPFVPNWIGTVRKTMNMPDDEQLVLARLERTWTELDARREEAIALGKNGEVDKARSVLLNEVQGRLSAELRGLCGQLIAIHEQHSTTTVWHAARRIRVTTWLVGIAGAMTLLLGAGLLWLFFYRVLRPLRGMVADAEMFHGNDLRRGPLSAEDELRLMGDHLRNLMSTVSDTRSRLEWSRHRLLAAEKLASVGRLAAGLAHEIRNPLTAMKMWLFSLQEAVHGNADLGRRLAIVSEEIARLEGIVRDFLEFSRPAPPQCQPHDLGGIVEQTLELLAPRLQGAKVRVIWEGAATANGDSPIFANRMAAGQSSVPDAAQPAKTGIVPRSALPPVMVDAGQIKQVLLNLLGNAVDAMPGGGEIRVTAATEKYADGRAMLVVRICDTGPGIPPDVQLRVFEPFFSTKEDGTGLGLCVAAQVMARHGGGLVLESSTEQGTTFAVWLPLAQEVLHAQDSRG